MVKLVRDLTLAAAAVAALALAFSAIVPPAPAAAQAGSSGVKPVAAMRQACAEDLRRLCPGVQPGGGRIQKCFLEKYSEISLACKSAMEEARAMKANSAQ